jgi:4-hydroxybenzoate polyprenyltransferase
MSESVVKPGGFSSLLSHDASRERTASAAEVFRGWRVTSRMEFLGDSLVHVMLPLLVALRRQPWRPELIERSFWVLVIWLLGHWVGSSLNCLADYPVDRLDQGRKARLAEAIDHAGSRNLLLVNLCEAMLATVVSVWLGFRFGKLLLPVFWVVGFAIAYLYSFEPARLKRRNWLNPLALTTVVYVMPFGFGYNLLSPVWNLLDVAVLFTYSVQIGASFFADEVPDHDEDRAMQVLTPCVTYGRVTSSLLAAGFYALSCLSSLVLFGYAVRIWSPGRIVSLTLAAIAYSWVLWKYLTLARISRLVDEAKSLRIRREQIQRLKKVSNTPAEIFVTSMGALLLAVAERWL